jgi:hypothetical protein
MTRTNALAMLGVVLAASVAACSYLVDADRSKVSDNLYQPTPMEAGPSDGSMGDSAPEDGSAGDGATGDSGTTDGNAGEAGGDATPGDGASGDSASGDGGGDASTD